MALVSRLLHVSRACLIWGSVPRGLCAANCRVITGSEPAFGPSLTRQFSSRDRRSIGNYTADPSMEEEFVFVDLIDADSVDEESDAAQRMQLMSSTPSSASSQTSLPGLSSRPHHHKHLRSLESQLKSLKNEDQQEAESDALIQFQDVEFPLEDNLVSAKTKKKKAKIKGEHTIFGTPDVNEPLSNTSCSGCGAILHCTAVYTPGYIPNEKYKVLLKDGGLEGATCQRCHLLTHHKKALELQVSRDEYRKVVKRLQPLRALVLLIVDLLDLPHTIIPDLPQLVGTNKHVVVLGNKVDLLPADSSDYLKRIKRQLVLYCQEAGFGDQITDVHLISAKTGYGVEALISSLQRSWKYKGDVFLVGIANAGKSTLFNTLLESDFCKSKARNIIQKATISPWPGTTLNLLKFPIMNPTPYRMLRRLDRLNTSDTEMSQEEHRRLAQLTKQGYLVGNVGRTFGAKPRLDEIEFDPDSLAFGDDVQHAETEVSKKTDAFTHNELKEAHWLHDTPGIMKENDVLDLLTEQEVKMVVPTYAITPRTFVLKPGMTLFVGGIARIDFLQGQKSCWFSVVAANPVPVHITRLEKADSVYEKHAGHVLLGVPMGGTERMKRFPELVSQEIKLKGRGHLEAASDITLTSAGWVAVTAVEDDEVTLRVHGPAGVRYSVRTPPLLPHIVTVKGKRIHKSVSYKSVKPRPLVNEGMKVKKR